MGQHLAKLWRNNIVELFDSQCTVCWVEIGSVWSGVMDFSCQRARSRNWTSSQTLYVRNAFLQKNEELSHQITSGTCISVRVQLNCRLKKDILSKCCDNVGNLLNLCETFNMLRSFNLTFTQCVHFQTFAQDTVTIYLRYGVYLHILLEMSSSSTLEVLWKLVKI